MRRNPLTAFLEDPPGFAMWRRVIPHPGLPAQPSILVHLRPGECATIPARPRIEYAASAILQDTVLLIPWMVRIEHRHEWIFETWINRSDNYARYALDELRRMHYLTLYLFEKTPEPVQTILTPNLVPWDQIRKAIPGQFWKKKAYAPAREKLYARWPTVQELWYALVEAPYTVEEQNAR